MTRTTRGYASGMVPSRKGARVMGEGIDPDRAEELKQQGWIEVGDDLLSPRLIEELRRRAATDPATDIAWDDLVREDEAGASSSDASPRSDDQRR